MISSRTALVLVVAGNVLAVGVSAFAQPPNPDTTPPDTTRPDTTPGSDVTAETPPVTDGSGAEVAPPTTGEAGTSSAGATSDPPSAPLAPRAGTDRDVPASATSASVGCASTVAHARRDAVVRVRTVGQSGAGFVVRHPRHVVTAFHLVAAGRSVTVVTHAGEEIVAEVLAVDRDLDVALLTLATPIAGVEPIPLTDEVAVGDVVVALGHPVRGMRSHDALMEGLPQGSATSGIASAVGPHAIQSDASLHSGSAGGPLLDCQGMALGVVVRGGSGVAIASRSANVRTLLDDASTQTGYAGRWRFELGFGLVSLIDHTGDVFWGGGISLGVVAFDRYALQARGMLAWSSTDVEDEAVFDRDQSRWAVELEAQYRLHFAIGDRFSMGLIFGLGGVFARTTVEEARLRLGFVDSCDPSMGACTADTFVDRASESDWTLRPQATLALVLGDSLRLGYAFQPDFGNIDATTHRLSLGLDF